MHILYLRGVSCRKYKAITKLKQETSLKWLVSCLFHTSFNSLPALNAGTLPAAI